MKKYYKCKHIGYFEQKGEGVYRCKKCNAYFFALRYRYIKQLVVRKY